MALDGPVAALLWKNWLLHKHHYVVTFFELLLPLLLSFQLVYLVSDIGSVSDSDDGNQIIHRNATIYAPFTPKNQLLSADLNIFYAPNTSFTRDLMEKAFRQYNNINLTAMVSEEHIEGLAKTRNDYFSSYVDGAVVFYGSDGDNVSSVLKYKLRLPARHLFDDADKSYYISNTPGPRRAISQYFTSGFLGMQVSIDLAFIEMCQEAEGLNATNVEFQVQRMPHPAYDEVNSKLTIINFVPTVIVYGLLVFCPVIVKRIADEKNNRAKQKIPLLQQGFQNPEILFQILMILEMMKLMGMSTRTYWASQFITNFIMMFILSGTITFLYSFETENWGSVLGNSSASLFFVVMMMYCAGSILFCFLITTFVNKASLAVSVTQILWIVSFNIPNSRLMSQGGDNCFASLSYCEKASWCLIPNMALTWAIKIMSAYEGFGIGAQWDNLSTPPFKGTDDFCLGTILTMMVISYILYGVLIWYVDAVWPWQPGLPKSPLFCFTASYSKKTSEIQPSITVTKPTTSDYFEEEPTETSPSIIISHLTKTFVMGGSTKCAVDDLSLNMYSGQITVLLGHNGAGKTTTMSVLTGMFPPTKGSVSINGYDILTETEAARKNLGLCPQHNVLYDSLTVEEHLKFFAGLKGIKWTDMNAEVTQILKQLQLTDKRYNMSKDLSGGMKRKLSLGIAMIGSQVLILDEPTSGMDPEARRVIWDALQNIRHGRTILLTTHYMEEADILGDRIAIMAKGSVQCCGSPIFLKGKFGAGYHLHISKGNGCKVSDITRIIQRHVPGASLVSNVNLELTYSLSSTTDGYFILFEELERSYQQLGIASCGVTITTMEDVFLKVGCMAEEGSLENCNAKSKPVVQETNSVAAASLFKCSNKSTGSKLFIQQIKALFTKRAIYAKRHPVMLIFQIVIPLIAFCYLVYYDADWKNKIDKIPNDLKLDLNDKFDESKGFCRLNEMTETTHSVGKHFNETLESESVQIIYTDDPQEFLLDVGSENLKSYKENYLVGGSISEREGNLSVTSWYNGNPYHLDPISINLMTTSLLRYFTKNNMSRIETLAHPLPGSLNLHFNAAQTDFPARLLYAVFVPLGLTFLSSSFVLFPIHERVTKAKLLQRMCGVNGFLHWMVNFEWDFLIHFFTCVLLITPFLVHDTICQFIEADAIGAMLFLLILYGISSIPLTYILSFIPNEPSTGFSLMTILNILSGMIAVIVMIIIQISESLEEATFDNILAILRILPSFAVTWGMSNIHTISKVNTNCDHVNKDLLEKVCSSEAALSFMPEFECCPEDVCKERCFKKKAYIVWDKDAAGMECGWMAATAIACFSIVILLETMLPTLWYNIKMKILSKKKQELVNNNNVGQTNEDDDVANERQSVENAFQLSKINEEALAVLNLKKYFGSFCAVNNITFSVHKEECFGLLGVNGAGKTTTFRMLAGDLLPTSGNAYINDYNIQVNVEQFQKLIGYCPQFDALIDRLTGRETLHLFGNLRGVPENEITQLVNKMLSLCDLDIHADKTTECYSGGTKRKLSLGMALIGAPSLVLLDEPTAGVDPASRRKIWETLVLMKQMLGISFILTSHGMDECEALCSRIAIMVNGQFRCLGAMQHLKSKFGQGYTLVIKIKQAESLNGENVQNMKRYIESCFPSAALKDSHEGILHYHIKDTSVKWSKMFSIMEVAKQRYQLEDYIVSDTTLEQIFIAFARGQKAV